MLVNEAAKKIGMNTQTLRLALQQGLFPFGVAVKTSPDRYTYKIFPKRLERYLEGTDYVENSNISDSMRDHAIRMYYTTSGNGGDGGSNTTAN